MLETMGKFVLIFLALVAIGFLIWWGACEYYISKNKKLREERDELQRTAEYDEEIRPR